MCLTQVHAGSGIALQGGGGGPVIDQYVFVSTFDAKNTTVPYCSFEEARQRDVLGRLQHESTKIFPYLEDWNPHV